METLGSGSLDVHISRDRQYGETSMMAFIKKHMGEILRPFAEHVDELHAGVDQLTEQLLATDSKAGMAHDRLDSHDKQIQVLRANLDKTHTLAAKTQAGLETCNAEKALLEADHQETKTNLAKVSVRLVDSIAHLQKLQAELDRTVVNLDKTNDSLKATQSHIKNSVDVTLVEHTGELAKHDAAIKATAQKLVAMKRFSEDAHEEFKVFVEATEKKDHKNTEHFERIDERITHLSTMLTETINRLNTHANHLRTTNQAVRPLQGIVDKLAGAQDAMNTVQQSHSSRIERVETVVDFQALHLDEMKGKFGKKDNNGEETGVRDVYDEVLRLRSLIDDNKENIAAMESQINGAVELIPRHDKRLLLLEQGTVHHADQLKHLQNTVGVETKEVPPPPPLQGTERAISIPKKIIREGPGIIQRKSFLDVVNQVSIKEKQKQYKDRLDDNEQKLENTNKMLSETNRELHDKMGLRVKMLEAKINNLVPTVDQLKAGQELTEEYWKGLSHGLRESHKMVAVDKELLKDQPRATSLSARGKALPALLPQASTPARTQDPRNAWGDKSSTRPPSAGRYQSGAPATARPPSAGRYSLGLAR